MTYEITLRVSENTLIEKYGVEMSPDEMVEAFCATAVGSEISTSEYLLVVESIEVSKEDN